MRLIRTVKSFVLTVFFTGIISGLFGQGMAPVKNFTEEEYKAHAQNFGICQDLHGMMYFANNDGILHFDGYKWNGYTLPNLNKCFSVYTGFNNTVFVGGEKEFGYLVQDNSAIKFISLTSLIPEKHRDFSIIWDIAGNAKYTVFHSHEKLFVYNGAKIDVTEAPPESRFRSIYKVGNDIYAINSVTGLMKLTQGKFEAVPDGERYGEIGVKGMFTHNNEIIICTGLNAFEYLNKNNIKSNPVWFDLPAKHGYEVYNAIKLSDGSICLATSNKGVVIFDLDGNITGTYNQENGLINDVVWYVCEDLHKNLWVATNKGLSFIELSSKIKKLNFVELNGESINTLVSYKNMLYIGTPHGLYGIQQQQEKFKLFSLLDRKEDIKDIIKVSCNPGDTDIIVATRNSGILKLDERNILEALDNRTDVEFYKVYHSRYDPSVFLALNPQFIIVYRFTDKRWQVEKTIRISGDYINSIVEPDKNIFWLGSRGKFYVMDIGKPADMGLIESRVPLPKKETPNTLFFMLRERICVSADNGIHFYDGGKWYKQDFIRNMHEERYLNVINSFSFDRNQSYWILATRGTASTNNGIMRYNQETRLFTWYDKFLKRLYSKQVNCIAQSGDIIWLATNDGLIYFHIDDFNKSLKPYKNLIFRVAVNGTDSLYSSRRWKQGYKSLQPDDTEVPVFPFKKNNIRFDFTAPHYIEPMNIRFATKLEPFEKEFTTYTKERFREFTNLAEGKYKFIVKSIDIYDSEGETDYFEFEILPPWYRTWPAYLLFTLSGVMVLLFIIRFNIRRLKRKNTILEALVQSRTIEIENQKSKIENINREITDSIKYAQMIQESILPSYDELYQIISDSFILYKPRDIVSGDFYWLHEFEDRKRIMLACADCTGHGVPGAFMSMMGMEKLNQAIKEINEPSSASILSYLNNEIKYTLGKHHQEREVRDGMEISLCDIDLEKLQVTFSGANRPLWLMNRQGELSVVKPTKSGIGGFTEKNQLYEQTVISLANGETVYLFTDGATDQFGGPKKKKLMSAGLKSTLHQIYNLPAREQFLYLQKFYTNWQGNEEQVDDILIIGFKLKN